MAQRISFFALFSFTFADLIVHMKKELVSLLRRSKLGNSLYYKQVSLRGKMPQMDYDFPNLISLEVASICNLSCIHCPSHNPAFKSQWRKYGVMDYQLFVRLMDEIDAHGKRNIALHKDGEPLLHPEIKRFLERVKKNCDHHVYLTTNGHHLTPEISEQILASGIDRLNISLGALTPEIYAKVRGGDIGKVLTNLDYFLKLREERKSPIGVSVQIINLDDYDMEEEISRFKAYWEGKSVQIDIWDELSWGIKEVNMQVNYRYPCLSLWNSFNVNSDGKVSACCIDWNQQLLIGDVNLQSIAEIWKDKPLQKLRQMHINHKEKELPLCDKCNYWYWQPYIGKYNL
jgi:radical SAM protein with 4Fe4S-binding SPASM domain